MTGRPCQLGEPAKQARELVQRFELSLDRGAYRCPKPLLVGGHLIEIRQLVIGFQLAAIRIRRILVRRCVCPSRQGRNSLVEAIEQDLCSPGALLGRQPQERSDMVLSAHHGSGYHDVTTVDHAVIVAERDRTSLAEASRCSLLCEIEVKEPAQTVFYLAHPRRRQGAHPLDKILLVHGRDLGGIDHGGPREPGDPPR